MSTESESKKIFLTPSELRARWRNKISLRTLSDWRYSKRIKGPEFIHIGRNPLYPLEGVIKYELSKLKTTEKGRNHADKNQ